LKEDHRGGERRKSRRFAVQSLRSLGRFFSRKGKTTAVPGEREGRRVTVHRLRTWEGSSPGKKRKATAVAKERKDHRSAARFPGKKQVRMPSNAKLLAKTDWFNHNL